MKIDRISIELLNRCAKACSFCYNASLPGGTQLWQAREVIQFVTDCANNGINAVSFGGGEPLQYPDLFEVLDSLRGKVFRSFTTNGLLLDQYLNDVSKAKPDKVHISIHFPGDREEVDRVIKQVSQLEENGIRSGINFLVANSQLEHAILAAQHVRASGIDNNRIVYLPMRITDTPKPNDMARVAGQANFQSMSCLLDCNRSERFCSLDSEKTVAWCSYTTARNPLTELSYGGLMTALTNLDLIYCGGMPSVDN
ncbi:MAG: radical SAM protein [Candidatus Obscuribacterales bacterium]|nr:radical SAM protein [Candidatus Obscuribacterales bacterium]